MKVLIIEDEKPAAGKLIRLLEEINGSMEVADILRSVEESVNWFRNNAVPDLVFMDIQLEDGTCFEIFEHLDLRVPVIFTTAFDAYTLKAFKVNSVDYLLKPVGKEDLKNALEKYRILHGEVKGPARIEKLLEQLRPKTKERFLIKIGEHYHSVQTSDIQCFYIRERCSFLFIRSGKHFPVEYSLEKIEQLVDPGLFFRINRNFIINYASISDVIAYSSSKLKIMIENWTELEDDILVSRERVTDFKKWMDR